ncbi:MAG: serine/threonine protein kinase, partial [Myxococcales bacterium]|nr:serine/threonine protein kinase [Myxococcales bacterium]
MCPTTGLRIESHNREPKRRTKRKRSRQRPEQAQMIGKVIQGIYRVVATIGEGGMSSIYEAEDLRRGRRVALKVLHPALADDAEAVARLRQEATVVATIGHQNVCEIFDMGQIEDGSHFLVMERLIGESLADRIKEAGSLDFRELGPLVRQILAALEAAHDKGILHRDLKPANVMVGPYGEVVLMDWGVAKPIGETDLPPDDTLEDPPPNESATRKRLVQTAASSLIGTPAYMSPEQARSSADLDARSDLYSACVVFHELQTTRHYLDDVHNVPAMLLAVMQRELPGTANVGAWTNTHQGVPPAEYVHFIRHGMQKDPAKRWPSAQAMIDELQGALDGNIRVQCPMTFTKRMTREAGRFVDHSPRLAVTTFAIGGALSL